MQASYAAVGRDFKDQEDFIGSEYTSSSVWSWFLSDGSLRDFLSLCKNNRKGSYTPLDILPSNRNQVLRQKSLLIGCEGRFQQECSQQFSPVADWMGSIDLFLEDEGQQYGNMEEAATVLLAWAHWRLSSMSIYRDTACCLCHLVDGSTWQKRRPS